MALAQSPNIHLDNLFIATKNTSSEIQPPVSIQDSAHSNRKVFLDIFFTIDNLNSVDSIEIKYGSSNGSGNILTMKLKYSSANGSGVFLYGNKTYTTNNNKIYLSELIPENTLLQHCYIWIRAKDKSGSYSNILSRQYN